MPFSSAMEEQVFLGQIAVGRRCNLSEGFWLWEEIMHQKFKDERREVHGIPSKTKTQLKNK